MRTVNLLKTVSAANDVRSAAYQLGDIQVFSVAVIFTGSNVAGTLTLECTNDETGASDFVTVANSSTSVTNSGNVMFNVEKAGYRWVRAYWDYTSGTGNITINLTAKENVVKPT